MKLVVLSDCDCLCHTTMPDCSRLFSPPSTPHFSFPALGPPSLDHSSHGFHWTGPRLPLLALVCLSFQSSWLQIKPRGGSLSLAGLFWNDRYPFPRTLPPADMAVQAEARVTGPTDEISQLYLILWKQLCWDSKGKRILWVNVQVTFALCCWGHAGLYIWTLMVASWGKAAASNGNSKAQFRVEIFAMHSCCLSHRN